MKNKKKQLKSFQHSELKQEIECLKKFNKQLKDRIKCLQDAIHEVYVSKKKYKNKYKQLKQKLQILQYIDSKQKKQYGGYITKANNLIEVDENYLIHKTQKGKRGVKSNQDDLVSLTLPTTHSNMRQQNDSQDSQKLSKCVIQNKNLLAGKIIKSSKVEEQKNSNQMQEIKQTLLSVKNQLQKFTFQLPEHPIISQDFTQKTNAKNMQQRLSQICLRLQRIQTIQKQQLDFKTSALKSKSSSAKSKIKSGSFLKTIEDIGRDLTQWKIGYQ